MAREARENFELLTGAVKAYMLKRGWRGAPKIYMLKRVGEGQPKFTCSRRLEGAPK